MAFNMRVTQGCKVKPAGEVYGRLWIALRLTAASLAINKGSLAGATMMIDAYTICSERVQSKLSGRYVYDTQIGSV
jgi:hypothetical protein